LIWDTCYEKSNPPARSPTVLMKKGQNGSLLFEPIIFYKFLRYRNLKNRNKDFYLFTIATLKNDLLFDRDTLKRKQKQLQMNTRNAQRFYNSFQIWIS
jgi:hypothetical protein